MNIVSAKYQTALMSDDIVSIYVDHGDNTASVVPVDQDNTDYIEILRQVEAGTLTIEEADNGSE
jgi:hypothetical protein